MVLENLKYLPYVECLWNKNKLFEMTFFVTNRCSFKCPFCFNNDLNTTPKLELNLEQISNVCDTLGPFCRLALSGGEPFMRKDIGEICEMFIKKNKVLHISIPTHAYYTDNVIAGADKIASVSKHTNLNISLSLDNLYEERDELVRIKDSFKHLLNTYWGLIKLKAKHKNLYVGTITTQCEENQYKLRDIYKFATETLKVDNFGFNYARGSNADKEIYRQFTEFLLKNYRSNIKTPFIYAKCKLVYDALYKDKPIPCYAGKLRKVISAEGRVYPCETILFGGGCYCTHECDLAINTLFNPKNLFKILF